MDKFFSKLKKYQKGKMIIQMAIDFFFDANGQLKFNVNGNGREKVKYINSQILETSFTSHYFLL